MPTDPRKQTVKDAIERYLYGRGIDTRRAFRCLNPEHEDRHPSMQYDPRRQKVHCFSCGADYDMFDLIGIEFGLTDAKATFAKAYEYFGLDTPRQADEAPAAPAPEIAAYIEAAAARLPGSPEALAYLAARGIGEGTALRHRLGFDAAWRSPAALRVGKNPPPSKRLIIPTGEESYVARAIGGDVEPRWAKMKEGRARMLNTQALLQAQPVFIVEGEMDMLSLAEVGYEAVSIGSVSSAGSLLSLLDAGGVKATLLLALDNDEAGRGAQAKLCEGLKARGIPYAEADILGGANDPNEALVADRDAFAEAVRAATQQQDEALSAYAATSAACHIQAFLDGIEASADTPAIPTGFAGLDKALDGGLYEGLYIVGAITSLGKTTFVLQMGDQIARQGHDVLIFSLEMARTELMAKSISRETLQYCLREGLPGEHAKTMRGITAGKRYERYSAREREIIRIAVGAYEGYAGRLYISEGIGNLGVDDVRAAVQRHITLTGRRPVVVVDYLQILAPYSDRATDKQNTDKAVLELKRISRDYKIPVLGISSFNRAGYGSRAQMESFKESGAIEYSSDVLIGLQCKGAGGQGFDVEKAKQQNPREVELMVLKNRNGAVGACVAYRYYTMFNYFSEEGDGWREV